MKSLAISVADAQRDMRFAYFSGAPGMLVSGIAWLAAGAVALNSSPKSAILALFAGGMLIHPLAVLLSKALGRPGAHTRGNPLGLLALESTIQMLLCMSLAYAVSLYRVEWFFPAMLFVIGGRYLTFSTMFGMRVYWACGAALVAAGYLLGKSDAALPIGAFAGGAIEIAFAAFVFATARGERRELVVEANA